MTIDELLSLEINKPSEEVFKKSREKWDAIAKPIDGLGDFEDMVSKIAGIQKRVCPDLSKKAHIIMCADNGVFEEGVSQTSQRVTYDVAKLMGERKSSVGSMTKGYPLDFFVYDVGINSEDTPEGVINAKIRKGTGNFVKGPAMEIRECLLAIETGINAVKRCHEEGYGIISTGEMGIGNTTTSTALLCVLEGLSPSDYTGKGAGLTESGLKKKTEVIEKGISLCNMEMTAAGEISKEEILRVLSFLGGLDIAALTGVFIGGALYGIPVVIDGLISAVAAFIAEKLLPGCRDYMLPSHMGREKGMTIIMCEMGLKPVINADLALGEGTGAVLLFPMLDMVMSLYGEGTSFEDTVIDQYERYDT
ncbi:nicotinate-nucleotide--dimethylbenzimidazole phosphoribosyltransferase [Butyrivibrio sp. AE3004]|uniref:nicotinate-nucleotide--dimethylbenzimidazole phosphoribosyltransferase n=1 Tax=Butyrivibrio sp. AE3004 TaxID=1506994 RepID=UPI00049438E9|nr:nicotinate-nucleotide--dimethylbenzimidazole phosphoribosyltransferase [Butyrivibrio sp. AE3004]